MLAVTNEFRKREALAWARRVDPHSVLVKRTVPERMTNRALDKVIHRLVGSELKAAMGSSNAPIPVSELGDGESPVRCGA